MRRQHSELEVELAARSLRRDEAARIALASPSRWVSGAVGFLVAILIQALAQAWRDLPGGLGIALAVLSGAVVMLSFDLHIARRRIDAIVQLLRLPSDA